MGCEFGIFDGEDLMGRFSPQSDDESVSQKAKGEGKEDNPCASPIEEGTRAIDFPHVVLVVRNHHKCDEFSGHASSEYHIAY